MIRRESGMTLIEMLATVAIAGSLFLVFGTILTTSQAEVLVFSRRSEALEAQWLVTERLRADIHKARSAEVVGGVLQLATAEGTVRYSAGPQGLVRKGKGVRVFPETGPAWFGLERRRFGTLVVYRIGAADARVAGKAIVGRDRGRTGGVR